MADHLINLLIVVVQSLTAIAIVYQQTILKRVERQTNGLTAALLVTTGDKKFAEGHKAARIEGEQKASAVAEAHAADRQ